MDPIVVFEKREGLKPKRALSLRSGPFYENTI